jgi:hypothetical protein
MFCLRLRGDYLELNERRARAADQQFDEDFTANAASHRLCELDLANDETVASISIRYRIEIAAKILVV